MPCRYNYASQALELFKDWELLASTANVALDDRTVSNTLVGKARWPGNGSHLNGSIAGLYVIDRHLSLDAMQSAASTLGYPVAFLAANNLGARAGGTALASWGGFTQGNATRQPVYASSRGYANGSYVTFTRTNSQHLNGGARRLNIASNGGFTAFALVLFSGTSAANERIFDFGNGDGNDTIALFRSSNTTGIAALVSTGPAQSSPVYSGAIVQSQWAVFGLR